LYRGHYEETAFLNGAEMSPLENVVSTELLWLKHVDSLGTQRKGNMCHYQRIGEDKLCASVNCRVCEVVIALEFKVRGTSTK
jgi:hypothetical protein